MAHDPGQFTAWCTTYSDPNATGEEGIMPSERSRDDTLYTTLVPNAAVKVWTLPIPVDTVVENGTVFLISLRCCKTDLNASITCTLKVDGTVRGAVDLGPLTSTDPSTITALLTTTAQDTVNSAVTLELKNKQTISSARYILRWYYYHDGSFVGVDDSSGDDVPRSAIAASNADPAQGTHSSPTETSTVAFAPSVRLTNIYPGDTLILTRYHDTVKTVAHSAYGAEPEDPVDIADVQTDIPAASTREVELSPTDYGSLFGLGANTYYTLVVKNADGDTMGTVAWEMLCTTLGALLLTSNGSEDDPYEWTNDAPRFDMLDRQYVSGGRVTSATWEWQVYSGGVWVEAGDLTAQVMSGYLPETMLVQLPGATPAPIEEPFTDGAQWRWRGKFGDQPFSEWGYFTFDLEETALKVTSHAGTLDSPSVVTDTTPTIAWTYTKTSGAYCVTVIDQADGSKHESTGWVSGDDAEYTLTEALEVGETYAVRVEVRDSVQQYTYAADLVYLHVNDPTVAAPTLTAEPNSDTKTAVVLEWDDPATTDGDDMSGFEIQVSRTFGGITTVETYNSNAVGDGGERYDLELNIGLLAVGTYEWTVRATDEHGMVGSWAVADEFSVVRADESEGTPDPGSPLTYDPVRPLVASEWVDFFDGAGAYIGRVQADVEWVQRLDATHTMTAKVPRLWLSKHGIRVSRPELLSGWEILYLDRHYTIVDIDSDLETEVKFSCRSREEWELRRIYGSTSVQPFLRIAQIANTIMEDLLAGEGQIVVPNAGFEDCYFDGYAGSVTNAYGTTNLFPIWRVDNWLFGWVRPWAAKVYDIREADQYLKIYADGTHQHVAEYKHWAPFLQPPALEDVAEQYAVLMPEQMFGGPPGSSFQVTLDLRVVNAATFAECTSQGLTVNVGVVWYAPDRKAIIGWDLTDVTEDVSDEWATVQSGVIDRKSEFMRPVLCIAQEAYEDWSVTAGVERPMLVDNMALQGWDLAPASNWTYHGHLYSRTADILWTDLGWIEFGTWTVGAADIYTNVAGNKLARIVTGEDIVIHFNAGGAGALADIELDGVVIEKGFDVSGAQTYTIANMNPKYEHIVTVVCKGGTVRIAKFVQDTWARITVNWADMNVLASLAELQAKLGGEFAFDTANRRIYHQTTIGDNLETDEVIQLRRGTNITRMSVREKRGRVANRLTLLGYGDGMNRLRVTVDAVGTNDAGETSQEVYGVQCDVYVNTDITDYHAGYLDCQKRAEEVCWPAVSYDVEVLDEAAAYLRPGDYVRCIYKDADLDLDVDEELRIMEIARNNGGRPARLVVGDRVGTLGDTLHDLVDQVNKLSRK